MTDVAADREPVGELSELVDHHRVGVLSDWAMAATSSAVSLSIRVA
ncbi:hypothetical protein [Microbispora sp. NBRC 16548]|nr:hypothetical protein [Microbispora sp. NBRC 16548]